MHACIAHWQRLADGVHVPFLVTCIRHSFFLRSACPCYIFQTCAHATRIRFRPLFVPSSLCSFFSPSLIADPPSHSLSLFFVPFSPLRWKHRSLRIGTSSVTRKRLGQSLLLDSRNEHRLHRPQVQRRVQCHQGQLHWTR